MHANLIQRENIWDEKQKDAYLKLYRGVLAQV
jgi:hypothetical protein